MTYSQLDLPLGGRLYVAELPFGIAPSLSNYRSLTQQLLDEIAPRETSWRLTHLPTGAPHLDAPDLDYSISLSHSGSYVGLVLCEGQHGIGVDLQIASDKLPRIAPRFMSPAELAHYHQLLAAEEPQAAREWLYTVWGLKEAAYKAYPPKVQRHLATNYIVSPPDASLSASRSSDKGSDSITRYSICADEGDDRPTLLTGYLLRSITTAPYHLTYVLYAGGAVLPAE
ncbi:MAG: 4'-phosphopantetheinyl transferase superfamily protein [Porphyromonas sp.]|uniref:4'-phosphopantetheinyl transferase family protein n=1 Tax=Porphyromonas sp. TaxID=1924944 RepID=UPI002A747724|nr:4'-phosphopantetheinyl transferase superfamily protein [Porphyromonas sp.]MDD6928270.1 4'-phosphopantetheinyl transferase superfamily protein [Bacteroidales bacterium]MDY3112212.1 4'-phosphopantetheinyl transferase superfamily protein [Porphyromonas sp.]